jgi:uncharacterized protein YidB (DUF937 family)
LGQSEASQLSKANHSRLFFAKENFMGLLDSIVGQLSGAPDGHADLVGAIGNLIQQHPDGLSGVVSKFEQGGLGNVIASWVGTGANLPISAQQLEAVLGSQQVQALASKLGISPQQASGHLAELLPQIINKLTPQGTVPQAGALGGLMAMLRQ